MLSAELFRDTRDVRAIHEKLLLQYEVSGNTSVRYLKFSVDDEVFMLNGIAVILINLSVGI